ncbi:MAG: hypothetical protein WCN98_06590 [Verrucomicrobiaceae bacterium]
MKPPAKAIAILVICLSSGCRTTVPVSVDGIPLSHAERQAVERQHPKLEEDFVRKMRETKSLSGEVGQLKTSLDDAHASLREKDKTIAGNYVREASVSLTLLAQDWRILQGIKSSSGPPTSTNRGRESAAVSDATTALTRHWRDYWRHVEELSRLSDDDVSTALTSHLVFLSTGGYQFQRRLTEHIGADRRYFISARMRPVSMEKFLTDLEQFAF